MKSILTLGSLLTVVAASAADGPFATASRANRWEIYGFGDYLSGANTTKAAGGGVELEFDKGFGGGVAFGYNINNHLNFNTEMGGGTIDLEARGFGNTIQGDATTFKWNLNLDYNVLKTRLTPFLSGGVGLMHFSGDFGGSSSEFSETDLSWGAGGGLRWDISDRWFVKAQYRATWASLKDSDNTTLFHGASVGVGFKF